MASFGLNTQTIGGVAGLIIVFLIIYLVMRLRMHRAEYGTLAERRLERQEGLGAFAKAFRHLLIAQREKKKKKGQLKNK